MTTWRAAAKEIRRSIKVGQVYVVESAALPGIIKAGQTSYLEKDKTCPEGEILPFDTGGIAAFFRPHEMAVCMTDIKVDRCKEEYLEPVEACWWWVDGLPDHIKRFRLPPGCQIDSRWRYWMKPVQHRWLVEYAIHACLRSCMVRELGLEYFFVSFNEAVRIAENVVNDLGEVRAPSVDPPRGPGWGWKKREAFRRAQNRAFILQTVEEWWSADAPCPAGVVR